MKIFSSLAILTFCTLQSLCQSGEEALRARLGLKNKPLPADQVFLHTDRNIYFPGDTIYFHAYIRDRQTGIFETGSITLYALLLGEDHKTIDSSRFRITNSTASGWLKVPDTISAGNSSLVSFTSRMMNYYPQFIFSTPVRIEKERIFRSRAGNSLNSKWANEFTVENEIQTIDLRFLPEGGTFIYGIRQRISFNAVNKQGNNLKCSGKIFNQKGKWITDFSSGIFGPGTIELTPYKGDTYFATLNGTEFDGLRWQLPVPDNSGAALRINKLSESLIETEVNFRDVNESPWTVALTMNNVLVLRQELNSDSVKKIRIDTSELPAGTAYITLLNSEMVPVAERPLFINPYKKIYIDILPSARTFKRGEETNLTINTTDVKGRNISSVVSISIADSAFTYYDSFAFQNIESTFLYDNQFWNNLPGKIKKYGLFGIDDRNLDQLLLTYGWRKYKPEDESEPLASGQLTDYDYLTIRNPGSARKVRTEIIISTLEGGEIISLNKDSNGEAILHFDTLDTKVREIMILPDKNNSKNASPVQTEFAFNEKFIRDVRSTDISLIIPGNEFLLKEAEDDVSLIDSAVHIEEVKIKAPVQPPKVYSDKYQEIYQYASLTTVSRAQIAGCQNLEDILSKLHPYRLDTKEKKIFLRPAAKLYGPPSPSLIVIDDVPLFEMNYSNIADMPAAQISSVTALKGKQGYAMYGEAAFGGVVFITTGWKKMADGDYSEKEFLPARPEDDLMRSISIFRKEAEYYLPSREEAAMIPEYQVRPTLFWADEIFLDGKGPVTITFPNNLLPGRKIIVANGVSFSDMPGAGKAEYLIK